MSQTSGGERTACGAAVATRATAARGVEHVAGATGEEGQQELAVSEGGPPAAPQGRWAPAS